MDSQLIEILIYIVWGICEFLVSVAGSQTLGKPRLPAQPPVQSLELPPDQRVHFLPELRSEAAVRCPVCSGAVSRDAVTCPSCEVPHHLDCMEYNRGCGIYGCSHRLEA
jgi:hypothetical protein